MGIIRAKQSIIGGPIPDEITRDVEYIAADAAHTSAVDPHPIYLSQAEGDGRYRQATVALTDADIPAAIARDSEIADQYLPRNPTHIEFGLGSGNYIDFHVQNSNSTIDFDARFAVTEGVNQNGQAKVSLQCALFSLIGALKVNSGAEIKRFLVTSTYIDLPSIPSGQVYDIFVSIPGAQVDDVAFFVPTVELYNGLWTFNCQAAVTSTNVARIYFCNLYNSPVDVGAFTGKLIVIGF